MQEMVLSTIQAFIALDLSMTFTYCANYSHLIEQCTHAMDVGVRGQPGLGKTSTNSLYRVEQ